MKNTMPQISRLQSRISKRRNTIQQVNHTISLLLQLHGMIAGMPLYAKVELEEYRNLAIEMGEDQKLDKKLFQMLLEESREEAREFERSWQAWRAFDYLADECIAFEGKVVGFSG